MNARIADAGHPGDALVHTTLRFAVAVTAAFVAFEMAQWQLGFLAPVLAGVLLASLPGRPPLKVSLVLVIVMAVEAQFVYAMSTLLRETPLVLFGLVMLCMFGSFHAMLSGKSALVFLLLLVCLTLIPVLTLVSIPGAQAMRTALIRGMAVAMVFVQLVFVLWPRTLPPAPKPAAAPLAPTAVRRALVSVAVMMPVMLLYLLFGWTDVLPVLAGTLVLVCSFDPRRGRAEARALILGNFAGGLLALCVHALLMTTPTLWFLAGLLFIVTLGIGQRIARGGLAKAVATPACNGMLIMLSSAIAAGPSSLSIWATRVLLFAIAGAFAVGMMYLYWFRAFPVPATPRAR